MIKINFVTKFILIIIFLPFIIIYKLLKIVGFVKDKRLDQSTETYGGHPLAYNGEKELVVISGADYASITKFSISEVEKLDRKAYEISILDANIDMEIIRDLKMTHLPTVCVFKNGKEIKRIQNLTDIDQILK